MTFVTNRPIKWLKSKRYLGALFADNYLISNNVPRTFVKGRLDSVPSRPVPYHSFTNRILQAWDVLFSKADALYWQESFEEEDDRLPPTQRTEDYKSN